MLGCVALQLGRKQFYLADSELVQRVFEGLVCLQAEYLQFAVQRVLGGGFSWGDRGVFQRFDLVLIGFRQRRRLYL